MKQQGLSVLEKAYLSLLIILAVRQIVTAKHSPAYFWHHLSHGAWKASRQLVKLSKYAEREYWKAVKNG